MTGKTQDVFVDVKVHVKQLSQHLTQPSKALLGTQGELAREEAARLAARSPPPPPNSQAPGPTPGTQAGATQALGPTSAAAPDQAAAAPDQAASDEAPAGPDANLTSANSAGAHPAPVVERTNTHV